MSENDIASWEGGTDSETVNGTGETNNELMGQIKISLVLRC